MGHSTSILPNTGLHRNRTGSGIINSERLGAVVGISVAVCAAVALYLLLLIRQKRKNMSLCRTRQVHRMPRQKAPRIHWVAPTVMVSSLFAGLLFALGYHLFYQNLAGKSSTKESLDLLGSNLSIQQFNLAVGTALAFLVKAFLVLAVSTGYVQTFWTIARTHHANKQLTVSHLDAAFCVLDNFLAFARLPLWLRNPLLLGLATTAWFVSFNHKFEQGC